MVSDLIGALVVAIVQGLTEWLPISSSGHLVLFSKLIGYSGGMLFDVALHFGTLMAVFVYFGSDIVDIVKDLLSGKWNSENGRLGLMVLVATIPAVIVGFLFKDVFESVFSSLWITALGFGVSGLFLFIGSIDLKNKKGFGYGKSLLVGCAQVFALFPGISRSGSTISSGLLLGLDEKAAMKFSFLMSVPVIFGANILTIGNNTLPPTLIWATLVSFVVGLATIHLLYKYILTTRKNLRWFAIYALILAIGSGIYFAVSL